MAQRQPRDTTTTTTTTTSSGTDSQEQQQFAYKVPSSLRPLLEAFARETLRNQPEDLVQFGCIFFDTLSKHRDSKKATNTSSLVESLVADKPAYERFRTELQQKLKSSNMARTTGCGSANAGSTTINSGGDQQLQRPHSPMDVAATKIQAAFRGHLVRTRPEKFGLDAEQVNGLCKNNKMRRNSNERLAPADNRKDLKRHSVGGYSHALQLSATPEDRAATKIQAEIRGYLTRKHLNNEKNEKKQSQEAATKIQAHIRGFLTRKHLEEQGIVLLSPPRSRTSTSINSLENEQMAMAK